MPRISPGAAPCAAASVLTRRSSDSGSANSLGWGGRPPPEGRGALGALGGAPQTFSVTTARGMFYLKESGKQEWLRYSRGRSERLCSAGGLCHSRRDSKQRLSYLHGGVSLRGPAEGGRGGGDAVLAEPGARGTDPAPAADRGILRGARCGAERRLYPVYACEHVCHIYNSIFLHNL